MLEQRQHHLWVDDDYDLAWTVAAIEGRTEDEVVDAYSGGRSEPVGWMEFSKAYVPEDDLGDYFMIQILSHGRHVVVIENNGWLGTRKEIVRRASVNGELFSLYWSPAGDRVVQATNGTITAWFEPLSVGDASGEGDTHPDWLRDVVFTTEGLHSTMLALMEQQSGLNFNRGWLSTSLPTYRIPAP